MQTDAIGALSRRTLRLPVQKAGFAVFGGVWRVPIWF
jgi:hypothetical protein